MISLSVSFLPHPPFYVHSFPSTQCSQIIRFFPTGWKISDKLIHTEGFNGLPFPKVVAIQEELKLGIWKDEALTVVSEPPGSSTQILHSPQSRTKWLLLASSAGPNWLRFGEMKETLVEPSGDPQPFPTTCPALFSALFYWLDIHCVGATRFLATDTWPTQDLRPSKKMSPCLDVASSASVLSPTLPVSPQIWTMIFLAIFLDFQVFLTPLLLLFLSFISCWTSLKLAWAWSMTCHPSSWISSCSQSSKNDDSRS